MSVPLRLFPKPALAATGNCDASVKRRSKKVPSPRSSKFATKALLEKVSLVRPGMNSASGRHLKKDGAVIDVEIVSHTLRFGGKRAELVLSMDLSNREKPKPEANQLVRDTRDTHGPSSL